MKKLLSILLLLSIFFTFNSSFAVVIQKDSMIDAANSLADRDIINDHENDPDNYNLYDNVLRQEIAAVARGVAGLDKKTKCDGIFDDVKLTDPNKWACFNVEPLVENDLISKNKFFRPEDKIKKGEVIAMLIKAIGFDYSYDKNNSKSWEQQVVEYAANKGVIENFTDYDTLATRGWVFLVADTTIKKDEEIKRIEIEEQKYSDEVMLEIENIIGIFE